MVETGFKLLIAEEAGPLTLKSPIATPVTPSLNVTLNTTPVVFTTFVNWVAGVFLKMVTVGKVLSIVKSLEVVPAADKLLPAIS